MKSILATLLLLAGCALERPYSGHFAREGDTLFQVASQHGLGMKERHYDPGCRASYWTGEEVLENSHPGFFGSMWWPDRRGWCVGVTFRDGLATSIVEGPNRWGWMRGN